MSSFDLERALHGAQVVTKSGQEVHDLRVLESIEGEFKVVGTINGEACWWTKEGMSISEFDYMDLVMGVEKCVGWVNVYRDKKTDRVRFGNMIFTDVTSAENEGASATITDYVCTTIIEWEE